MLPILGDIPSDRIKPAHIRRWHAQVSAVTRPTAVRQAHAVLRAVFITAVSDNLLQLNPCRINGARRAYSPERPLLSLADDHNLEAGLLRIEQQVVAEVAGGAARRKGTLATAYVLTGSDTSTATSVNHRSHRRGTPAPRTALRRLHREEGP